MDQSVGTAGQRTSTFMSGWRRTLAKLPNVLTRGSLQNTWAARERGQAMQTQRVPLALTDDEAFVLYDWLTRFNQLDMTDVADQAEQRVLFDLEVRLEKIVLALVQADYTTRVVQARAMGRAACPQRSGHVDGGVPRLYRGKRRDGCV